GSDVLGTIVAGGSAQTVTIPSPGRNARLTFTATAGQRVSRRATSGTIASVIVQILDPGGSVLTTASLGTSGGFLEPIVLATAGSYTVFVDPQGRHNRNIPLTLH